MAEPTGKVERVDGGKKGRRYKAAHVQPPMVSLVPLFADMLKGLVPKPDADAPSVTTILGALAKPALVSWAAREERKMIAALSGQVYERLYKIVDEPVSPEQFVQIVNEEAGKGAHLKLLRKAGEVGTQVHRRIEWTFKGELGLEREPIEPPITSPQAQRAWERWVEWRQTVNLKVIAIEKRLFSSLFGFGGTLDALVEINGVLAIIDFKTGKHVYGEAFLQNVAYRLALWEEGIYAKEGWIVRLPKYEEDPEFDAVPVPPDNNLTITFLALIIVYKWWEASKPSKKDFKKNDQRTEG